MSNLTHLVDRYYWLKNELNVYFEEHIKPEVDACTTKKDLLAVQHRISEELVQSNGLIRDLPGEWSVKFALKFNEIEFGGLKS